MSSTQITKYVAYTSELRAIASRAVVTWSIEANLCTKASFAVIAIHISFTVRVPL